VANHLVAQYNYAVAKVGEMFPRSTVTMCSLISRCSDTLMDESVCGAIPREDRLKYIQALWEQLLASHPHAMIGYTTAAQSLERWNAIGAARQLFKQGLHAFTLPRPSRPKSLQQHGWTLSDGVERWTRLRQHNKRRTLSFFVAHDNALILLLLRERKATGGKRKRGKDQLVQVKVTTGRRNAPSPDRLHLPRPKRAVSRALGRWKAEPHKCQTKS